MKPIRIGLVGAGAISGAHMPAFASHASHVELTAVCDKDDAAARRRAAEGGLSDEAVYTEFARMVREAPIDAVLICTTHAAHAPLAVEAAMACKHVLVEKPMACTLDECRQMVAAHERSGTTLMVGQMQRFDPSFRGMLKLLNSGALGAVRAVRLDAMQNLHAYAKPGHWLYDGRLAGGGILISVMIHPIDLLRFLIGDVSNVSAVCRTCGAGFIHGAEDYAAGTIEFENGAIGDFFGTYSGPKHPYSESIYIFAEGGTICSLPAWGTYRGQAKVSLVSESPITNWASQYEGFVAVEPEAEELPTSNPFVNQMLHFADCCRAGREPISSGLDNIRSIAVVMAAYESSRRGGVKVRVLTE